MWASHVFIHPEAAPFPDLQVGYVDAALLKLPTPITGAAVGWNASPTAYVGQQVKCYGYGWVSEAGTNPPTGTLPNGLRDATLSITATAGEPKVGSLLLDYRRYKINKTSTGVALAPGDSGGPCFDVSTNAQVGVQSTVAYYPSTNLLRWAEQTKFNYIRDWVIYIISNY